MPANSDAFPQDYTNRKSDWAPQLDDNDAIHRLHPNPRDRQDLTNRTSFKPNRPDQCMMIRLLTSMTMTRHMLITIIATRGSIIFFLLEIISIRNNTLNQSINPANNNTSTPVFFCNEDKMTSNSGMNFSHTRNNANLQQPVETLDGHLGEQQFTETRFCKECRISRAISMHPLVVGAMASALAIIARLLEAIVHIQTTNTSSPTINDHHRHHDKDVPARNTW